MNNFHTRQYCVNEIGLRFPGKLIVVEVNLLKLIDLVSDMVSFLSFCTVPISMFFKQPKTRAMEYSLLELYK